MEQYVIGADFGSDSVRAVIVRASDGATVGESVCAYPRWKAGKYQHAERAIFRQHPEDYIESFTDCVRGALDQVPDEVRKNVVGIGVDTTGSTPAPVDAEGRLLALTPAYEEDENAMFWLWKDHSAAREAEEINQAFGQGAGGRINYLKYQGRYSAEWFWAKILCAVRRQPSLRRDAYAWVEHCDVMVALLTGQQAPDTLYHSACAAGHKAYWHSAWSGLPDMETLEKIDSYLRTVAEHYGRSPQPADVCAGTITREWAQRLGLPETVKVSGSQFDAHSGAVGAGIRKKTLICTIGTSAVDMVVARPEDLAGKDISRFGGQAEESILPGYVGIETGQAAFGDIFAWFKRLILWPLEDAAADPGDGRQSPENLAKAEQIWEAGKLRDWIGDRILRRLQEEAEKLPMEPWPVSLDWMNGRRYPDTDDAQRGVVTGLSLGTTAPAFYRSLVFAAVCGLNRICQGYLAAGIRIDHVRAVGGISKKSPYVMQMMADVLGKEITILDSDQTCALGAAINAAVASGCYDSIDQASARMAAREIRTFVPNPELAEFYGKKYQEYLNLAEKMG